MRLPIVLVAATLLLPACGAWAQVPASQPASATRVVVPAYFYPTPQSFWKQLTEAARRVPVLAIANVDSGPGKELADPAYADAIASFRQAGGKVIGYVSTRYAKRPLDQVKADVDRWYKLYAVDGIFVDEMTNTADETHLRYYERLAHHIRAGEDRRMVMANPGCNTVEEYLKRKTTDTLVTFEQEKGYEEYEPSPWTSRYDPACFVHLPYNVPTEAGMQHCLQLARTRRAGGIYITDDTGSNPWDTLPKYWQSLVDALIEGGPTSGEGQ